MSGTGVAEIPETGIAEVSDCEDLESIEIHDGLEEVLGEEEEENVEPLEVEEKERNTENQSLLGKDETKKKKKKRKEGTGSLLSSIINCLNAILGGALLSLPFAFKQAGFIIGIILIMFCAVFSLYTMVLLALSADKTKIYNFSSLSYYTYGRFGRLFSNLSLFGCLFGTLCAYFVIIGDFITPLINTWAGINLSRVVVMTIAIVILLPLTLLQNMSALSFTSFIALGSVIYVMCMVITKGIIVLVEEGLPKDFLLINPSVDILHAFSIIVFSYSVQFNVLPIQKELSNPTPLRMGITSTISSIVSSTVYLLIGAFGYITFSSQVSGNILTNYDDTAITVQIGRIALTMTILFSYPVVAFPLKIVLTNALFKNFCPGFSKAYSIVLNMTMTVFIIGSTFLVAVFVPDVSIIFGILGGLTLSFVCFVIPSMIYYKLNESRWFSIHSILPFFMSIFGVLVAVVTLVYESKKLVELIISLIPKTPIIPPDL